MGKKVPHKLPILVVYGTDEEEELFHRRNNAECLQLGQRVIDLKRPRHIDKLQEKWSDFDTFGAHAGEDDLSIIERQYIIDCEGDEELACKQTDWVGRLRLLVAEGFDSGLEPGTIIPSDTTVK